MATSPNSIKSADANMENEGESRISTAEIDKQLIDKQLFDHTMRCKWDRVIQIYRDYPHAQMKKITKSGDTALHVAAADGQEEVVVRLIDSVKGELDVVQNDIGNTALHVAATHGNANMCKTIGRKNRKLIGTRNNDTETPLFLTVLHGKMEAFLRLVDLCNKNEVYEYGRRNNGGETILHCALAGEYFDIAFVIITRFEEFVNSVTVAGVTPLHLLANNPTAFRSGSHVRGWHKLIYNCIFVDDLYQKSSNYFLEMEQFKYHEKANYPENYQTCKNFGLFFYKIMDIQWRKGNQQHDTENPKNKRKQKSSNNNKQEDSKLSPSKSAKAIKKNQQKEREAAKEQSNEDIIGQVMKKYKGRQGYELVPANYHTCFRFIQFFCEILLVVLGFGSNEIVKIRDKKEKHKWSLQIMGKLLEKATMYEYEHDGNDRSHLPPPPTDETTPYTYNEDGLVGFSLEFLNLPHEVSEDSSETNTSANPNKTSNGKKEKEAGVKRNNKKETPILLAAENGVLELVEMIVRLFPVAIHDVDEEGKNLALLAVENRQPHVYKFLLNHPLRATILRKTDKEGNSALHLAAKMSYHRPWRIPGAALQMQWEIKWYKFVKSSMPSHFFTRYNGMGQTAHDMFAEKHGDLVKEGCAWLISTSESCSLVAALIATVAFATSATVPGGVKQESGTPTLEKEPAFSLFAISSLIALCFSVTSVVMFLAILTSRYQTKDFYKDLPRKLILGMSSLFVSIAAMLVSFCAGHFFVLKSKLEYAAMPIYAITCFPITVFAIAQFPLYFDLIKAMFTTVPQRSFK